MTTKVKTSQMQTVSLVNYFANFIHFFNMLSPNTSDLLLLVM